MNKKLAVTLIVILAVAALVLGGLFAKNLMDQDELQKKWDQTQAELTRNFEDAKAKIESLTGDLTSANEQNETLTGDLATANTQIESLTGDLTTAKEQNETLTGDLAAAKEQNETLTGDLAAANEKAETLTKDLENANAKAATAQEQAEAATAEKTALAAEVERFKMKQTELETELQTNSAALTQANSELETAKADLEAKKTQIETMSGDLENAKSQLANAQNSGTVSPVTVPDSDGTLDATKFFTAALKENGIKYSYEGVNPNDDTEDIVTSIWTIKEVDVKFIIFLKDDGRIMIRAFNVIDYNKISRAKVLEALNGLNTDYLFVTWLVDDSDDSVTAKYDLPSVEARDAGRIGYPAMDAMVDVVNAAMDVLKPYMK